MDRQAQLLELVRRMSSATSESDWSALAALDKELARLLRRMPARPTQQEQVALDEMHRVHTRALEECEREASRVDEVLVQMRLHREGWMAYALGHEQDEAKL